jgi:hypothetical protein
MDPGTCRQRVSRLKRLASATAPAFLLLFAVCGCSNPTAVAVQPTMPAMPWQAMGNPYVWTMGDSITAACTINTRTGGGMGIGWRDLGHIAWPGANAGQIIDRLQGIGTWPAETVTEDPGMEQVWFRDAGVWIIELGTNDARSRTPDQYRADVRWFLDRSNGRPVVWVNSQDPDWEHPGSDVPVKVAALNDILVEEAMTHSNMRIVDWAAFIGTHPHDVRSDGVHPADGYACDDLFGLIAKAVPAAEAPSPRGSSSG